MANILVVDDSAIMRKVLCDILKSAGYIVESVDSGIKALRKLNEKTYDLISLDIAMPEMGGIEVLNEVLTQDPEQKCVMCSAMSQQNMVTHALECGAKDFILKPFDHERVLNAVNKLLAC